jgi:hypothetical protein
MTEQTPNNDNVCYQSLGAEVGKVKKAGAVRKLGGAKTVKGKRSRSGVTSVTKVTRKVASKRQRQKPAARKTTGGRTKRLPPAPVSTFRVRELDPLEKCGPGTSVQRMFRVDEASGGVVRPHLVFFDRHGLYCEHGRDCPAVPHARSVMAHGNSKHLTTTGPTHNGRMRA